MKATFGKHEKLKSKKAIELLFSQGKSVSKFPLRLIYVALDNGEPEQHVFGVSVSKKYFKKAVNRNYFKRVMRECIRHHKLQLAQNVPQPHAFMLLYQTKEKLSYWEIEQKYRELLAKFYQTQTSNTL